MILVISLSSFVFSCSCQVAYRPVSLLTAYTSQALQLHAMNNLSTRLQLLLLPRLYLLQRPAARLASWTSAALTPWQACHLCVHSAHWTGKNEVQGQLGMCV
jgi:hypothetical protein